MEFISGSHESFFQTKGLIKEALQLCASRGLYCFSNSIQNMLLDRGFSEAVCKTDNGAFISLMKSEEAVKFLLMQVGTLVITFQHYSIITCHKSDVRISFDFINCNI